LDVSEAEVKNILTRTTGFLKTVTSHSLQPYQGCSYGNSLCGVGCYVQHNFWVMKGRPWGGFLEVRTNAADSYRESVERERRWARKARGRFGIFMSSSTDPFVPQEKKHGVSRSVLEAMVDIPPDQLILQTHSHQVVVYTDLIQSISTKCGLRVHVSIETDMESVPGLPPHASSVDDRFDAAKRLKDSGIEVVITVSPLLPIQDPDAFFARIARSASAVVLDHYIEGDGSPEGRRTLQTPLPDAIRAINSDAVSLNYRDRMAETAERYLPGRVGISIDGFAGRFRPAHNQRQTEKGKHGIDQ